MKIQTLVKIKLLIRMSRSMGRGSKFQIERNKLEAMATMGEGWKMIQIANIIPLMSEVQLLPLHVIHTMHSTQVWHMAWRARWESGKSSNEPRVSHKGKSFEAVRGSTYTVLYNKDLGVSKNSRSFSLMEGLLKSDNPSRKTLYQSMELDKTDADPKESVKIHDLKLENLDSSVVQVLTTCKNSRASVFCEVGSKHLINASRVSCAVD